MIELYTHTALDRVIIFYEKTPLSDSRLGRKGILDLYFNTVDHY